MLLFLFYPLLILSQPVLADSRIAELQNTLRKTRDDSSRAEVFYLLAKASFRTDSTQAWQYAQKAEQLA